MKKFIFIILGCFIINQINAQGYHPIPNDSVWWVEEISFPYMGGPCIEFRKSYIYPVGNQTISGTTYTEFRQNLLVFYDYFGPFPSPCPSSGYSLSNQFYALIRNDSLNQRVYLYDSAITNSEILLYNFNVNVGDTVPGINGYQFDGCPNDTFIVQAIDSINIGGEFRKRIEINGNGWGQIFMIESIGSNLGFAYPIYCPFETNTGLICYHHNQFEYGNITSNYCTQTLDAQQIIQEPASFVNPLGNNCYEINLGAQSGQVFCMDATGRAINTITVHHNQVMNLQELNSGIYYLIIYVQHQNAQVCKVVITH